MTYPYNATESEDEKIANFFLKKISGSHYWREVTIYENGKTCIRSRNSWDDFAIFWETITRCGILYETAL